MTTAGGDSFAAQLIDRLASAGVVVMASDNQDRITSWNDAAATTFGWSAEEAIGRDVVDLLIEPRLRPRIRSSMAQLRESGIGRRGRFRGVRRDRAPVIVEFAIVPFDDPEHGLCLAGISTDVTDLANEYETLRQGVVRFGRLTESSPIGIVIGSLHDGVSYINKRGAEILGAEPERLLGRKWIDRIHPEDRDWVIDQFLRHVEKGVEVDTTFRVVRPDGSTVLLGLKAGPFSDDATTDRWVGIFDDVTERQHLQEELAHQAQHDPLTGLPNRTVLLERMELAVARARNTDAVAALFIDLDHFKTVNDSFGHESGDFVLLAVAERLKGAVRPSDTVSRLGGDEFVVLCEGIHTGGDAQVVLRRVRRSLQRPIHLPDGREAGVSASVGVAVSGPDIGIGQLSPPALLAAADQAMYRVKRRRGKQ